MDSEETLYSILDRIKLDAPSWKVDFTDPSCAFTIWAEHPHRMLYCGNRASLELAGMLADEYRNQTRSSLYVVDATVNPIAIDSI